MPLDGDASRSGLLPPLSAGQCPVPRPCPAPLPGGCHCYLEVVVSRTVLAAGTCRSACVPSIPTSKPAHDLFKIRITGINRTVKCRLDHLERHRQGQEMQPLSLRLDGPHSMMRREAAIDELADAGRTRVVPCPADAKNKSTTKPPADPSNANADPRPPPSQSRQWPFSPADGHRPACPA